jgi:hypothetical protein
MMANALPQKGQERSYISRLVWVICAPPTRVSKMELDVRFLCVEMAFRLFDLFLGFFTDFLQVVG